MSSTPLGNGNIPLCDEKNVHQKQKIIHKVQLQGYMVLSTEN